MILYALIALIARAKDGAVLVESIVPGVKGNHPQVSIELLERIVSSSTPTSALLGTKNNNAGAVSTDASTTMDLLPDGARRTFVQRHDEPLFGAFLGALAAGQCGFFGGAAAVNADVESGNKSNDSNNYQSNSDMDYYFHLIRHNNIICLCISDDTDIRQHMVNYNFLDDVKDKFAKSFSSHRIAKAKSYEMDKTFRRELGKLLYFYNENRGKMVRQDKVDALLTNMDDLKVVLGRNITMVLEREKRLDMLVEQSEEMLSDTKVGSIFLFLFFCLEMIL